MKSKCKITRNCMTCNGDGVLGIEYYPVADTPCTDCGGDCQVVTYEDRWQYKDVSALHLDYPPNKIVSHEIVSHEV